jgi:hypothetical protein
VHRAQPSRTGAAQEAEQERLRLIVARVAERHDVGVQLDARPLEEAVTRGSRGVFDRPAFPASQISDVRTINDEGSSETVSQRDAKRLVTVSFRAQLVVEMSKSHKTALAHPIELGEQVNHCHRVGPARRRRHHGCIRCKQPVAPDRFSNATQ